MLGWCVGCNPPFVKCGIRLIGLPAPHGRLFTGVCLPFPHAGRHVSPLHTQHSQQLNMHHRRLHEWTFRFCSVAKALALHPYECCISTCGRSFLKSPIGTRKPHANSPAQTQQCALVRNKNFGSFILSNTLSPSVNERLRHD
jgi:hypothetical protein